MNVLIAPNLSSWRLRIFLAGGISNCRNWQDEFIRTTFETHQQVLFVNPRRENFDVNNLALTDEQIEWEFNQLNLASITVFFFCEETICPIALYELGRKSNSGDYIVVGYDSDYCRKLDVIKQIALARPDIEVVEGLDATVLSLKKLLDKLEG